MSKKTRKAVAPGVAASGPRLRLSVGRSHRGSVG